MPRLKNYTAPEVPGVRMQGRASPEAFGADVAAAAGGLGGGMQAAGEQIMRSREEQDLRRAQLEAAKLRTEMSAAFEEAHRTGRDYDEVAEQFSERMSAADEFAETRAGRQAIELQRIQIQREFNTALVRHKAVRAGEEAQAALLDFSEVAGQGLTNDPTLADAYKANLRNLVDTYSDLSPQQRDALYQEFAADLDQTAAARMADIAPEFVLANAGKPGMWQDLTPQQRAAVVGKAKENIWRAKTRARQEEMWARQDQAHRGDIAYADYSTKLLYPEGGNRSEILREAAENPDMTGGQIQGLYRLNEALLEDAQRPLQSDPTKLVNLITRLTLPYGDPQKITTLDAVNEAMANRQLSRTDYEYLVRLYEADRDPQGRDFLQRAKPLMEEVARRVDKSTMLKTDPQGKAQYAKWHQDFMERYRAKREENKDPSVLLDTRSPEYAGNLLSAQSRAGLPVQLEHIERITETPVDRWHKMTETERAAIPRITPNLTAEQGQEMYDALEPGDLYIYVDEGGNPIPMEKRQAAPVPPSPTGPAAP